MKMIDYRKSKKLTLKELAKKIDIGICSLNRYGKGQRIPAPEVMQKIYEATGGLDSAE